jgi:hypothetical protein
MDRRDFITLLGGAVAVSPLGARAQQQNERVRRVGVLLPAAPDDSQMQAFVGAFLQALALAKTRFQDPVPPWTDVLCFEPHVVDSIFGRTA